MKLLSIDFLVRMVAATAITFSIAALAGGFSEAKAATAVPDCRHDTYPVDRGLYAKDILADNVEVSPWSVLKGQKVTMTYKKNGKIKSVECMTSEARAAYKNRQGKIIDVRCGNEYVNGVTVPAVATPAVASVPAPAASVATVVTCSGEMQLDGSCIEHRTQIVIVDTVPMRRCQGDPILHPIGYECRFVVGPTVFIPARTTVACPNCAKATVSNFTSTTDGKCQAVVYNGNQRHTVAFGRVRREAPDSRYVLTVHAVDGQEVPQAKKAILLGQVAGSYAYVDGGTDACHSTVTRAVASNWPDVLTAAGLPSGCTMSP